MGTPRRRYPSDHRAYFRVLESILDDERLNALDLADQMVFIRLLATLNRLESTDGSCFLPWRSVCAVTMRYRRAYAEAALSRLHAADLVAVRWSDAGVSLTVDKWPEIQGFAPTLLRRSSDATPPPRGEERKSDSDPSSSVEIIPRTEAVLDSSKRATRTPSRGSDASAQGEPDGRIRALESEEKAAQEAAFEAAVEKLRQLRVARGLEPEDGAQVNLAPRRGPA